MRFLRENDWSKDNQTQAHPDTNGHECTDTMPPIVCCGGPSVEPLQEKTKSSAPPGRLINLFSRTASRISVDPGPPPDGGLEAWIQALMGHLVVFNTWGYINSFGVFQVKSWAVLQTQYLCQVDVLRHSIPAVTICHLVDWFSPDLFAVRNWLCIRTSHRRRVLQANVSYRLDAAAARYFHDLSVL